MQQLERDCRKKPECASIEPEERKEDLVPYRIVCIKRCMVNEAKAQHCFDELYLGNPVRASTDSYDCLIILHSLQVVFVIDFVVVDQCIRVLDYAALIASLLL